MVIKDLDLLRKKSGNGLEVIIEELPKKVKIIDYALEKGFTINRLVREIYGRSYEWYGFLIAEKKQPEVIIDIGIPENAVNSYTYTKVEPEQVQKFLIELKENGKDDYFVNGWIHSHGNLGFRQFSSTDEQNMKVMLNFTSSHTTKPIAKKEVLISNLAVVSQNGKPIEEILKENDGSIVIITQNEPGELRIFDTIYGCFGYSIVIGDEGWSKQKIMYRKHSIISRIDEYWTEDAEIELIETEKRIENVELEALKEEIKQKIKPYSWDWRSWERYYEETPWYSFWDKKRKKRKRHLLVENQPEEETIYKKENEKEISNSKPNQNQDQSLENDRGKT
jgi:hypothetical protein